MRRGGPLRRVTPLRNLKPLRRAALQGNRDHYRHLRALVHAREGGCCARCGADAPITVGTIQHRQKRSQGGPDDPWNCVWTCYSCNAGWIEDFPVEATRQGWTVPSWADPREWPVRRESGWWQPGPDGWTKTNPHPSQIEQQETA